MTQSEKIIKPIIIGLAIFAMYFGAGNIAFPINMGRASGYHNNFAIIGMLITSILIPFIGLISLLIIKGDYQTFFGLPGKRVGFILSILIMGLIGPFGATPRCLALSYTTFNLYIKDMSSLEFGILGSVIIFFFSYKKSYIVDLIGKFLTPILLISLIIILIVGTTNTYNMSYSVSQYSDKYCALIVGLQEGLNTMDLFASFFFSIIVFPSLKDYIGSEENLTPVNILKWSVVSSLIAMCLLSTIYYGMSFIASHDLVILREVELSKQLGIIATYFLGQNASILANLIVSLACLTTAITLVVIFSEFIRKESFFNKISYRLVLTATISTSLIMGQLGFTGLVVVLKPILFTLYPMLVVLSLCNIARVFFDFHHSAVICYLVFFITLFIKII